MTAPHAAILEVGASLAGTHNAYIAPLSAATSAPLARLDSTICKIMRCHGLVCCPALHS